MSKKKLLNVKGKKFDRFVEIVSQLRPNVEVKAWKHLGSNERKVKLSGFFATQGFSDDEERRITKHVFRIRIPYRTIGAAVIGVFLIFLFYKFRQFEKLPRIYALGNDIIVIDSKDERVTSHLDLFGRSLSDSSRVSTGSTMILAGEKDSVFLGKKDGFFNWLFNGNLYAIRKVDVSTDKNLKNEFERIFEQTKKSPSLLKLSVTDRKAILQCIQSKNELFNATINNSSSNDSSKAHQPFVTAWGPDGHRYIFLCFKTQSGSYITGKITLKNEQFQTFNEISYLDKTFDKPLIWSIRKLDAQQPIPFIRFEPQNSKDIYESLAPPYELFIKR